MHRRFFPLAAGLFLAMTGSALAFASIPAAAAELAAPALVTDGAKLRKDEAGAGEIQSAAAALDGARRKHVEALLAAVNANTPQAVRRFFEQHVTPQFTLARPMAAHEAVFQRAYRDSTGLDLRALRAYDPAGGSVTLILQDRAFGNWYSVPVRFDAGAQGRIAELGFVPIAPPALEGALSEAAMLAEVGGALEQACKKGNFSGTMLIARGDKVLLEKACGEASKRYHALNNIDTKFNLGSMNKMFTSVAIAQLVEQGRLKYDDKLSAYIDESWLPKDIAAKITIHQILSHTSGLGNYFNAKFMESSRLLFREISDYKPLLVGEKLAFEPGQRYQYSNIGMLLAGVVIEKVSGENYFDYVRTHVSAKAGMPHTDSYAMDDPVENLATGYFPDKHQAGRWIDNSFEHVLRGGPAGGGYSTVRDLHQFARALQSQQLLKQESVERLWQDHSKQGYGYGFQIQNGDAGKVVGHSGGFPGLNGHLDIYLDRGYTVAVLSNLDRGAWPLSNRIKGLIGQMR